MDFVGAHFAKDEWGLVEYSGVAQYEYEGDMGKIPGWGTARYNYAKAEVQAYLLGALPKSWVAKRMWRIAISPAMLTESSSETIWYEVSFIILRCVAVCGLGDLSRSMHTYMYTDTYIPGSSWSSIYVKFVPFHPKKKSYEETQHLHTWKILYTHTYVCARMPASVYDHMNDMCTFLRFRHKYTEFLEDYFAPTFLHILYGALDILYGVWI